MEQRKLAFKNTSHKMESIRSCPVPKLSVVTSPRVERFDVNWEVKGFDRTLERSVALGFPENLIQRTYFDFESDSPVTILYRNLNDKEYLIVIT
jgi:hypothetical protein